MEKLWMCRICLVNDIQMHLISDTRLQNVYEALTSKPFETEDERPVFTCYLCHALLQNCYKLKMECLHSEELLTQMLSGNPINLSDRPLIKRLEVMHPVVQFNFVSDVEETTENVVDNYLEMAVDVKIEHQNGEDSDMSTMEGNPIRTDVNLENNGLWEEVTPDENSVRIFVSRNENQTNLGIVENSVTTEATHENEISTGGIRNENGVTTDLTIENITRSTDITTVKNCIKTGSMRGENFLKTNITLEGNSKRTNVTLSSPTDNICPMVLKVVLERLALEDNKTSVLLQQTSSLPRQKGIEVVPKLSKTKKNQQKQTSIKTYTKSNIVNCVKSIVKTSRNNQKSPSKKYSTKKIAFSDINKENIIKIAKVKTGKKIKPFMCDICKKCFTVKDSLRIHIRTHTEEKPYKCDICDKSFHLKYPLMLHYRNHTGVKPYKCDVCHKGFYRKYCLDRHIVIHSATRPYSCDQCGKSFNVLSNLTQHIRIHTGDKSFKCDVCGKGFIQRRSLVMHVRIHTDEKPYMCDICKRYFCSSETLLKHFSKAHSNNNPYKCEVCKRHFICNSNYVRHKRKHNKKQSKIL